MEVTGSRSCDDKICFPCVASKFEDVLEQKFENLGENSQTKEFTTGNLSLIFQGIKGRKGTKKPVFFFSDTGTKITRGSCTWEHTRTSSQRMA